MRPLLAALLLAFAVPALASEPEPINLIELFNYHEYSPRLASSGQPTREQLPLVAEAGVEAVINLAPATEPGAYADEGDRVRGLGMGYAHIPVDWEAPSRADRDAFLAAMKRFEGRRMLVHCYANARASAFTYLWRTLAAGHDPAEARATLVGIWDLNPGYELANVPQWLAFVDAAGDPDAP